MVSEAESMDQKGIEWVGARKIEFGLVASGYCEWI